jgi:hypothetical protein
MTKLLVELLIANRQGVCVALLAVAIGFPATMVGQALDRQPGATDTEVAKASDTTAQQPSYPEQKPQYPGAPPTKGKLEGTMGPLKLRFYGTLLLNISVSDSAEVGQDVPLWAAPGAGTVTFPDGTSRHAGTIHDTIFTARQSLFGFTFSPASPPSSGWTPSGVLEFDFFGSRPSDTLQPQGRVLNQPRLRLAYLQLEKGTWKIVAGQDKMIIAPLDPVSLSHVAIPLGATAGNLWGWLPQVRLDVTHNLAEKTSALFQFGVLRPLFGDPRFVPSGAIPGELPASGTAVDGAFSGFGERSSSPFYQARIAVSHPMAGSTATIGAGAHYGRERIGADRTLDSWAFAFDYNIPLHSRVILRGEGFLGSNLVPFQGGVLQGVAASPATPPFTTINRIGSGGGWGELTLRATEDNRNIFYLGAGTDDPQDHKLLPGTGREKNSFAWVSYFRKLTNGVTLAFEWSNWQFRTKSFPSGSKGPSGRGNVFNLSLAYQF